MSNTTAKTQGAHHVGLTVPELGAACAFFLDALGFELGAHRRIDVLVTTADPVAGRLRQRRNAAHEGAADSQYVYVHGCRGSLIFFRLVSCPADHLPCRQWIFVAGKARRRTIAGLWQAAATPPSAKRPDEFGK